MNPIFYRDFSSGGEKPFPYLIIEDFYDEEELGQVWRELEFLLDGNKLMGPEDTGALHILMELLQNRIGVCFWIICTPTGLSQIS